MKIDLDEIERLARVGCADNIFPPVHGEELAALARAVRAAQTVAAEADWLDKNSACVNALRIALAPFRRE